MKKRKRSRDLLLVFFLLSFLSGCSNAEEMQANRTDYIVGVVTKSDTSEYWMSVNAGMLAAARRYDMKVVTLAPDSELDWEVQQKQVEKLIERGVDAVAVAPINSYKEPDYAKLLADGHITAVSFDTGFESVSMPYIGIDNYGTGYRLAEELANEMGFKGEIGIVAGDMEQKGHRDRVEGFCAYIQKVEDMRVEFVESGYGNLQMSEQKVRDLMYRHPNVTGIMATSGVTALGLADELYGTGIRIAAVDEQKDALDAVENGKITVLAAQSGYDIGYETIRYIDGLRQGEISEKDSVKNIPVELVTKENVAEYRRESEKKKYTK